MKRVLWLLVAGTALSGAAAVYSTATAGSAEADEAPVSATVAR